MYFLTLKPHGMRFANQLQEIYFLVKNDTGSACHRILIAKLII
jgi:predicted cupin superfamily sugar epimerase